MDLEDLREILISERETGGLIIIPPETYNAGQDEIKNLSTKYLQMDNQLSREAREIFEEIDSIESTINEIFEIRTRKIIVLALSQSSSNYNDHDEIKRMTVSEKIMFDTVLNSIDLCKRSNIIHAEIKRPEDSCEPTIDQIDPEDKTTDIPNPSEHLEQPVQSLQSLKSPDVPHEETSGKKQPDNKYLLIRVLQDLDSFLGIDGRTYTLTKGDILTLPLKNSEALISRNAVEAICVK